MSADEIFESLGYEKQNMYLDILEYKNKKECIAIEFDLRDKKIYINDDGDEAIFVNI